MANHPDATPVRLATERLNAGATERPATTSPATPPIATTALAATKAVDDASTTPTTTGGEWPSVSVTDVASATTQGHGSHHVTRRPSHIPPVEELLSEIAEATEWLRELKALFKLAEARDARAKGERS